MAVTRAEMEAINTLRDREAARFNAAEKLMAPMLRQRAAAERLIRREMAAAEKLMAPMLRQQAAAEKLIRREMAAAEKLMAPMLRQQAAAEKLLQAALTPPPRAPDRDHLDLSFRVPPPLRVSNWTPDVERPEPPPEPPRRRPGFAPW